MSGSSDANHPTTGIYNGKKRPRCVSEIDTEQGWFHLLALYGLATALIGFTGVDSIHNAVLARRTEQLLEKLIGIVIDSAPPALCQCFGHSYELRVVV